MPLPNVVTVTRGQEHDALITPSPHLLSQSAPTAMSGSCLIALAPPVAIIVVGRL